MTAIAPVIGDHAERDVVVGRPAAVRPGRELLGDGDEPAQQVGVVVTVHLLDDRRHPLEPHAGVDVLRGQIGQGAAGLAVALDEDQVPDLHVAGAARVHAADVPGRAVAGPRTAVEVDLGARATGAGLPHLPEVVLGAAAQHALGGEIGHLRPEHGRFLVGLEDRGVQL